MQLYIRFPLAQCTTEKLIKKFSEEREIEDALQRLDKLTLEDVRTAVAQTFGAVHGLVDDVREFREGRQCLRY